MLAYSYISIDQKLALGVSKIKIKQEHQQRKSRRPLSAWKETFGQVEAKRMMNSSLNINKNLFGCLLIQTIQTKSEVRLLTGFLRYYLKTLDKAESDMCQFCECEIETVEYVFRYCRILTTVAKLWSRVYNSKYGGGNSIKEDPKIRVKHRSWLVKSTVLVVDQIGRRDGYYKYLTLLKLHYNYRSSIVYYQNCQKIINRPNALNY